MESEKTWKQLTEEINPGNDEFLPESESQSILQSERLLRSLWLQTNKTNLPRAVLLHGIVRLRESEDLIACREFCEVGVD